MNNQKSIEALTVSLNHEEQGTLFFNGQTAVSIFAYRFLRPFRVSYK